MSSDNQASNQPKFVSRSGTVIWSIFLTVGLAMGVLDGSATANLHYYGDIRPFVLVQSLLVIAVVALIATFLWNIGGIFRCSWWTLGRKVKHYFSIYETRDAVHSQKFDSSKIVNYEEMADFNEDTEERPVHQKEKVEERGMSNVNLIPFKIKYFGLIFGVFALLNLPYLAYLEESIFRRGTSGWFDGTVRSLLFGFAHVLFAGVPVSTGIAISVAGLAFTNYYFQGGIAESTVYHTSYNLIVISALMIWVVGAHFADSKQEEQST